MHTPLSDTSTAPCEGTDKSTLQIPPIMDRYGNAADIGHKSRMEDTSMCVPFSGGGAFGVFDGHGGAGAAEFIKDYMRNVILRSLDSSRDKEDTLSRSYSLTEEALESFLCETEMPKLRAYFDDDFEDDDEYPLMTSGSTACVCLVDESTSPGSLAVANAGDCRAVLCRRGEAIDLTRDHNLKSCTEDERRRVAPYLQSASSEYLGGLAVTRSLGDLRASSGSKNAGQIAEPEITSMPLEKDDEFIILATDGLFDVVSSKTAVETVRRHMLGRQATPATAARYLIDRAIARHAADNICVPVTPALERLIETEGQAGTMTYASLVRALESCHPDAGRTHQPTYKLQEVRPQPALPPHRDPVSWESEVAGASTDDDIRLTVASLMSGRISTHQFVTRLAKCGIEVDEDIEMLILRHEEDPSNAKLDEFVSALLEKRDASIGRGMEPKHKIEVPYALDTEPDPSTQIQRQQEYPKEIIANLGDKGGEFTRRLNPKRRGNYKNSGDILSWKPSLTEDPASTHAKTFPVGGRKSIKTLPTSSDILRYSVEHSGEHPDPAEVFSGGKRRVYPSSRSPPPFGTELDMFK
ncbi:hypothetical protein FOZ60_013786 [Perkinsus olseni]|uniref:PPM-type phosphatase domain-containing protein n=1 Tax=Perkinsus olseni TaxID=32597 RepID=A0A7J6P838_PEROL|nr:hypothetical protein FOZ60_013786 [Perkinsus olseni]